ncbi:MAG: hypothetical protein ACI4WW_02670 [Candidatus Coprovivens sp.]
MKQYQYGFKNKNDENEKYYLSIYAPTLDGALRRAKQKVKEYYGNDYVVFSIQELE